MRTRFATSVVMSIAYGRRTATLDDPLIKQHEDAVMGESQCETLPRRLLMVDVKISRGRRECASYVVG